MITRASRSLTYLGDLRTDAWISRASGIPIETIGYVRTGERNLPGEYAAPLRNLYQREAYQNMRDIGFSFHQARRFSSYAPQGVTERSTTIKNIITELATGHAANAIDKLEKLGKPYSAEAVYNDSYRKMQEAMRRSHKDYETQRDYLT